MDSALQSFFSVVPQAAAIWISILLVLAVAVAAARLPRSLATEPDPEADRYVTEVESAVGEAAATAARRRTEWLAAQEAVEKAWADYEEAEEAARRISAATAFPLMSRRRKPGDNIDRQRYLHRAATELCRTQDLSIAQLNDVYAHRGWNPRLHPVQQEAALRDAVRAHRLETYRQAVVEEQAAWRGADAAADTLRDLRAEAATARLQDPAAEPADQQWWSDHWTGAELSAAA